MMKAAEKSHTKTIRCPICSARLLDAKSEDVENARLFEMKETQEADLIVKCPRCRKKIGLVFKNNG